MSQWRFLAERLTGDGAGEVFEPEIELTVTAINETLSGPPTITASIASQDVRTPAYDGRPVLEPWGTAIYAEADNIIRAGALVRPSKWTGNNWSLDLAGFSCYPKDMPYDGSVYYIDADPLNIYRDIWTHLQSQPNGNLGLTVDPLVSPVRVGTQIEDVTFQTAAGEQAAFEAGPRKLNYWTTRDLGKEIDDYATETPFDWLEEHWWEGDVIRHNIRLGYPSLGTRRNDLGGLVLGVNLNTDPSVAESEYVNQVYSLGAGEGRAQIRGYAGTTDNRLRRAKTIEDKSDRSLTSANARAAVALSAARGELTVDSIEIIDHPNAPIWGITLGDELPLYAETDGGVVDQWVRVIGRSTSPGKPDVATLTIVRSTTT